MLCNMITHAVNSVFSNLNLSSTKKKTRDLKHYEIFGDRFFLHFSIPFILQY